MTENVLNKRIGKNIKRYRLIYNANVGSLTQKELADKINVSVSLIGSMESENITHGISLYNLYKISEVLGVPVGKFFE